MPDLGCAFRSAGLRGELCRLCELLDAAVFPLEFSHAALVLFPDAFLVVQYDIQLTTAAADDLLHEVVLEAVGRADQKQFFGGSDVVLRKCHDLEIDQVLPVFECRFFQDASGVPPELPDCFDIRDDFKTCQSSGDGDIHAGDVAFRQLPKQAVIFSAGLNPDAQGIGPTAFTKQAGIVFRNFGKDLFGRFQGAARVQVNFGCDDLAINPEENGHEDIVLFHVAGFPFKFLFSVSVVC